MKDKSNVPKRGQPEPIKPSLRDLARERRKAKPAFPDHPVDIVDFDNLPQITQGEIDHYANAAYRYELAWADFERNRANLAYKLTMGSKLEAGDSQAHVDKDGRIILTQKCSTCGSWFDPERPE